jgi:hypothetical protein
MPCLRPISFNLPAQPFNGALLKSVLKYRSLNENQTITDYIVSHQKEKSFDKKYLEFQLEESGMTTFSAVLTQTPSQWNALQIPCRLIDLQGHILSLWREHTDLVKKGLFFGSLGDRLLPKERETAKWVPGTAK